MRTSRVSQETARLVNALSPSRRRSTRQSLRSSANEGEAAGQDEANGVESEDLIATPGQEDSRSARKSNLGKRKRDAGETATNDLDSSITTPVRRSPRKADNATKRKPRRQPAKHIKGPKGTLTIEPPPNWEKVYNTTAAMRKRVLASVDTMGCESLAETHRSPRDQRLQTLISLMLSSQTKDTVTAAAMKNLQENLPGGLTLESLLKVDPAKLNDLIGKVGFHNTKTKHIKAASLILRSQYNSDIPDSISGLVSLPGVGPKMAYLTMSAAWGRDEGIGVDVHVHRITNLWGWHKTSTPEQTRMELEGWLPRGKWHEINHLLVGFGQTICLPVGRRCGECDLAAEGLCPGMVPMGKRAPVEKKVKREVEVGVEDGVARGGEVKSEVVVEADDVGVKIEADLEEEGKIEIQALASSEPDPTTNLTLEAG